MLNAINYFNLVWLIFLLLLHSRLILSIYVYFLRNTILLMLMKIESWSVLFMRWNQPISMSPMLLALGILFHCPMWCTSALHLWVALLSLGCKYALDQYYPFLHADSVKCLDMLITIAINVCKYHFFHATKL